MENFDYGVEAIPGSFGEMFLNGTVKDGTIGVIDDSTSEIGPRRCGVFAPMLLRP